MKNQQKLRTALVGVLLVTMSLLLSSCLVVRGHGHERHHREMHGERI